MSVVSEPGCACTEMRPGVCRVVVPVSGVRLTQLPPSGALMNSIGPASGVATLISCAGGAVPPAAPTKIRPVGRTTAPSGVPGGNTCKSTRNVCGELLAVAPVKRIRPT